MEAAITNRSLLETRLREGKFVVTTELAPPDSANPSEVYRRASVFQGCVDAINATDGSGAHCHMSSISVCALLIREGYSMIMQVSCRDRNRIAIQGDILGAAALGVQNVLCLTGDGVEAGDHPEAKPVFDLDSTSLLGVTVQMRDKARFLSGRRISDPPNIFVGAVENPFAPPYDFRAARLAKKVRAGARFIQTQYCFDVPRLEQFMQRLRDFELPDSVHVIVGVGVLASARSADWIRSNVPGVRIPDSVVDRLRRATNPVSEGRDICVEIIQQLREVPGVDGVHIMAYGQEESVPMIVDRSGL